MSVDDGEGILVDEVVAIFIFVDDSAAIGGRSGGYWYIRMWLLVDDV